MDKKKEDILLDAILRNAIDCAAFEAELANGHSIIAFMGPGDREFTPSEFADKLIAGVSVRVSMSPFDMSKGRITGLSNTGGS